MTKNIGNNAFDGCDRIDDLVLPSSVVSMGRYAFSGKHTSFGDCLYLGNEKNPYHVLVRSTNEDRETIEIHEDTKVVAAYAFAGHGRITKVTMPKGIEYVCEWAFNDCEKLKTVTIPKTCKRINDAAFYGCSALKNVKILNGDILIGESVFRRCGEVTITAPASSQIKEYVEKSGLTFVGR
jgi:hypothetical protein